MNISDVGIRLIANFEGKRNSVYLDAVGLPTIGIGHLIKRGETFPKVMTDKEVYDLFRKDVKIYENYVNDYVKVKLNQNQFDALVSFTFNLGGGALQKSGLLRWLNAGEYERAANEFPKWSYAGGKKLLGLERRRKAEMELFLMSDKNKVPEKKWYDEVMKWATDNNIMSDGRPDDNVTRAELATMLKNFHDKFIAK